jgi:hypothetical protein
MLLILVASGAGSTPVDPEVRLAVTRYDALEFRAVVRLLNQALARPELSTADRRAALSYLGRALAVTREHERATQTFVDLLRLDPQFTVSDYESPLIREALRQARIRSNLAVSPTPIVAVALPDKSHGDPSSATAAATAPPDVTVSPPLWQRPWFLALAGVVVSGAVVTAVVVASTDSSPSLPEVTLGRWSLP